MKRPCTAGLLWLLLWDDVDDGTLEDKEFDNDVFKIICKTASDREEFELVAVASDVRILISSKTEITD